MLDVKKDLSEFMQLTGKTQREISREAGLSPSVISQFLNGTYIGDNKEVANTLMKYLRVAKDRLLLMCLCHLHTAKVIRRSYLMSF